MAPDQDTRGVSANVTGQSVVLFAVRYGIAGVMIMAGLVVLLAVGGELGAYGFASAVGAGLSVLLLNLLFRMSVSGDRDRDREEAARRYFDEHAVWPPEDEADTEGEHRILGHRWTLAPGVATAEQEEHGGLTASGGRVPTTHAQRQ